MTRRADLELNPVAALYGHGAIDATQYDTLGLLSLWLRRAVHAFGGRDGSCAGLWQAIVGAGIGTGYVAAPVAAAGGFGLGDAARRALARACRQLNGQRDLIIALAENRVPSLVLRAIEGRLSRADKVELERLRQGLDAIAGRRPHRSVDHLSI